MEFEAIKQYLLNKPESTLDFPFGDDVFVFKVKGKMFALIGWREGVMSINLKCDPDESAALRDIFAAIKPGYHMDKKHWITVYFDTKNYATSPPDGEVERLIDNSFKLVVSKMTKKDQKSILMHI